MLTEKNEVLMYPFEKLVPTIPNLRNIANEIVGSENPLASYISVKAWEKVLETVKEDNLFRKKVKDQFLDVSQGALNRTEIWGVEIQPYSLEKKNKLSKVYQYSSNIQEMESEIEFIESELKLKKDALKNRKLFEIDHEIAVEITPESIIGQEVQKADEVNNILDSFNLRISFKNQ